MTIFQKKMYSKTRYLILAVSVFLFIIVGGDAKGDDSGAQTTQTQLAQITTNVSAPTNNLGIVLNQSTNVSTAYTLNQSLAGLVSVPLNGVVTGQWNTNSITNSTGEINQNQQTTVDVTSSSLVGFAARNVETVNVSSPQFEGVSNQFITSSSGGQLTSVTISDGQGRTITSELTQSMLQNGVLTITLGGFYCSTCSITYNFTTPEPEACSYTTSYSLTPFASNPTTALEGGSVTYKFTPGNFNSGTKFSFVCPTGATCSYPRMEFGSLNALEDVTGGKRWRIDAQQYMYGTNGLEASDHIEFTISKLPIGTYNLSSTLDRGLGINGASCDGAFGNSQYNLTVSRDTAPDSICDSAWRSVLGSGTTSDQPVGVYIPSGSNSANSNSIGVLVRGTDNGLYYQACKFFGDNTKCSWNNTWQNIPGKTLNAAPFTYLTSTWEVAVRDASNNVSRSRNFTGGWDSFLQDSTPTNQPWGTPSSTTDSLGRFWKFKKNSDNTISYMCGTPKNDATCNGIATTLNKDLTTGKYNAAPGATFSTDVFMTNSGTKVWTGQYYNLGTAFANSNELWGGNRIHIPTDPVLEGQTVKFGNIARTVPAKTISGPETKTLAFQMVQDGGEWIPSNLTDENAPSTSICKVDVVVKNACFKVQNLSFTKNRSDQTITLNWDSSNTAQRYGVRIADLLDGSYNTDASKRIDITAFSGQNCGAHYVCENSVTTNSLTFRSVPGHSYIAWIHAEVDGDLCEPSNSSFVTEDTSALNFRVWQDDNGNGGKDAGEKWLVDSTTNTTVPSCTGSGVTYANVAGLNIVLKQNGTTVSTDKLGCDTGGSNLNKYLPAGTYTAEVSVPSGWQLTYPASQPVTLNAIAGQSPENARWFALRPFVAPQNVVPSCVGTNLSMTWDAVSGATSQYYYGRFYDETANTAAAYSGVLTTPTYSISNATKGHTYSYWAHNTVASGQTWSAAVPPAYPDANRKFVTCPPPEPPTISGSCSADGKTGTVTWTLPSGYTKSAIRVVDVNKPSEFIYRADSFSSPPYTKNFDTKKNTTYDAWIHTVDSNGILSSVAPHTIIACGNTCEEPTPCGNPNTCYAKTGCDLACGSTKVDDICGTCGGNVLVDVCNAVEPTCGSTTQGTTSCGVPCSKVGATCEFPPGSVSTTCNSTTLTMTWPHVSGPHYYLARFYDETVKQLAAASAVITDNTYSITNATPGHDYSYWVHATNIDGTIVGPASPAQNARVNVACVPPPPTPQPTADNSVCSQITISWTPGLGGGAVVNYRVHRNSSNDFNTATNISGNLSNTATSFVDTTVSGTNLYYYWVEATNSGGRSYSAISGGSVASLVCTANLSSSDKDIISVTPKNGSATNYSTTDCGASDTNTRIFRINDKIRFRINICNNNNLSKAAASSIVVSDTLTNLQQSGGSWNVGSTWGVLTPVVSGTAPNQTLTFTVPNSLAKSTKGYIEFDAETSSSSSANTARYQNCANIRYNNSISNVSTGDFCTPLYLFYQGGSVPGVIEVAP
jgi:hypothetical protein